MGNNVNYRITFKNRIKKQTDVIFHSDEKGHQITFQITFNS